MGSEKEGAVERPEAIWVFEVNRRRYAKGNTSEPIWREHWTREEILGETARSYLISPSWKPRKIPKRRDARQRLFIAFSEAELDVLEWIAVSRSEIYKRILSIHGLSTAQLVALADAFEIAVPDFVRAAAATQEPKR